MKKYLSLLLVMTLLFALTACGNEANPSSSEKGEDSDSGERASGQGGLIEESVFYDEGGIKITATKLEDSEYSMNLDLNMINKSEDFIQIDIGDEERSLNSMNGFMIYTTPMVTRLEPGHQAANTVYFNKRDMETLGIKKVADIGLGVQFLNKDYELLKTEFFTIQTALHGAHDYSKDEFQELYSTQEETERLGFSVDAFIKDSLYDAKGLKHISTVLHTSNRGFKSLLLEFEKVGSSIIRTECVS